MLNQPGNSSESLGELGLAVSMTGDILGDWVIFYRLYRTPTPTPSLSDQHATGALWPLSEVEEGIVSIEATLRDSKH